MNIKSALNTLPTSDPRFRELRIGEFGYMLADLETRMIHISNMFVDQIPCEAKRKTTQHFDSFLIAATTLFAGDDLKKVINEGLLIHQGFFDGTF